MPRLDGRTHVNLTVAELQRSTDFYTAVFGFLVVNEVTPPESGFTFRTLIDPGSFSSIVLGTPHDHQGERFDEHRTGLHHIGYHVPERADLDEWAEHLASIGVAHDGIRESQHEAGAQIWFRDPDDIWLEVYWANREFFRDRLKQSWRQGRGPFRARGPNRRAGSPRR